MEMRFFDKPGGEQLGVTEIEVRFGDDGVVQWHAPHCQRGMPKGATYCEAWEDGSRVLRGMCSYAPDEAATGLQAMKSLSQKIREL